MKTVPGDFPSTGSGPPAPVAETATSAPRSRLTPAAICIAHVAVTTGPGLTPSTSNLTREL